MNRETHYASKGGWSLEVIELITGKWRASASKKVGRDEHHETHQIGDRLTLVMAQMAAERWAP